MLYIFILDLQEILGTFLWKDTKRPAHISKQYSANPNMYL